jgi:catechol 2,3-dioxygenase-like lactoylglutathione lyase family enzyme
MTEGKKPRLIGINHVAIEVGNIDEALAWYGQIFDFKLRGKGERNAFIDMGDQFVNMTLVPDHAVNGVEKRHLGFVVDDRSCIIKLAKAAGAHFVEGLREQFGERVRVIDLPRAGHFLLLEQPEAVTRGVAEFVGAGTVPR